MFTTVRLFDNNGITVCIRHASHAGHIRAAGKFLFFVVREQRESVYFRCFETTISRD